MFDLSGLALRVFARSPVDLVSAHMNVSCACASLLPDFFHHVFAGDWASALLVMQNIHDLESQADEKKKQVLINAYNTLEECIGFQEASKLGQVNEMMDYGSMRDSFKKNETKNGN